MSLISSDLYALSLSLFLSHFHFLFNYPLPIFHFKSCCLFIYSNQTGAVYAVEFSHRVGRELMEVAKKRTNVVPIIEDARKPQKYRMLVPMVDVLFADVAQPDQARILAVNAHYFLKNEGGFVISIKANCIDSTAPAEHVFAQQVCYKKMMIIFQKRQD